MWSELVRATSTVCPASVVLWVSESGAWEACGWMMIRKGSQRQGKGMDKNRAGVGITDNVRLGSGEMVLELLERNEAGKGKRMETGKLLQRDLRK